MDSTIRQLCVLCLGVFAAVIAACSTPGATQCEALGIICPATYHCAAAQAICIKDSAHCGDSHKDVDEGEECDDGNTRDGDGCSHECKIELCGNGRTDATAAVPEQCDDGKDKNGKLPSKCSATCQLVVCGNGVVEQGEQCDDGNADAGDGCSDKCQSEFCGNGNIDFGEVCDHGALNGTPGDSCSANCRSNLSCDNKIVDPGEECDHGTFGAGNPTGNNDSNDCRADCQFNRCGDGFVDNQAGARHEQCDRGHLTGLTPNPTEADDCNIDCTMPQCGDGKINRHFKPNGVDTEQCDNGAGNSNNADCTSTCQVNACGDGNRDDAPGPLHEDCDLGPLNGMLGSNCTTTCHLVNCGNGVLDQGEQCDDGAANDDNGRCKTNCKFNVCGDGFTYSAAEQCDGGLNGTPRDTPTCDIDCTKPVCGDGNINLQAGETCDDGDKNGTAASPNHCDRNCHPQSCGNGLLDPGEQCDPGNGSPAADIATCNFNCTVPKCGDGHPNTLAGEDCDDGVDNGTMNSTCSTTCHMIHCGNGIKEQGEDCDDGAANDDNGRCKTSCKFNVCGDGKVFTGVEQCDEGNGTPRDTATCDSDCTLPVCGDHHTNSSLLNGTPLEVCDDGDKNGTAASPNNCDLLCRHQGCGNGLLESGEQCDPATGSPATDSATCTFDCKISFCGDSHTNVSLLNGTPVEVCDEGATNGDPCPYGTPSCTRCSNDCLHNDLHPGGPFCGDSVRQMQFGEQCDPGGGVDLITGNPHPVDIATCNFDCTNATCGDGHINLVALEVCDNFNGTCGTCTGACKTPVTAAAAHGSIQAQAAQMDITAGDTFTLNDGIHGDVVFEFVFSGSPTPPHVKVSVKTTDSADDVATAMQTAIDSQSSVLNISTAIEVTALDTVVLTNTKNTRLGNQTIGRTGKVGMTFGFIDLAGGFAGDCLTNAGCRTDDDCKFTCNTSTHKCR